MFFLFILICIVFMTGGGMVLMGLISNKQRHLVRTGLITCGAPIIIMIIASFSESGLKVFKHHPSEKEIVGEYEMLEVTNLNIDKASYYNYRLVFKSNGSFTLTPTPYIKVCESGKYSVDYSSENNEIDYQCGDAHIMGRIDARYGDYRIEFVVGDPDSDQSIFFGKKNPRR